MTRATLTAVVATILSLGCHSDRRAGLAGDDAAGSPSTDGGGHDDPSTGGEPSASGSDTGGAEGDADAGAAGTKGSGGEGSTQPLFGDHPIVESAALDCANSTGPSPLLVLPASPANPVYDRMGEVGQRRFAFSRDSRTLFTFDASGHVSTTLSDVAAVASHGAELSVVFANAEQAVVQRYDETLTAVGKAVSLEPGAFAGVAAAASETRMLVSWNDAANLMVNILSSGDTASLSIPLSEAEQRCHSQALTLADDFAILSVCSGASSRVRLTMVSSSGELLASDIVFELEASLDLVGFAPTQDGFAFAVHDLQQGRAYVVRLDAQGTPIDPILSIPGIVLAFDLAAETPGVSMTAQLATGVTALGRLSSEGDGTWTCLDQTSPGSCAALLVAGATSSVLVRYANGSAWLMEVP